MSGRPWLTIIGIGDGGLASLSPEACDALDAATTILAPRRVLDTIGTDGREWLDWSMGVKETVDLLLSRRGDPLAILATGDPMHFGIGATLAKRLEAGELRVLPSPSAFSLAAARLGWALQDVESISLHGHAVSNLAVSVGAGRRILALTSDGKTVALAARLLSELGYGASRLSVFEHMGGERERREALRADEIGDRSFADFNTLAIECRREGPVVVDGPGPGLSDEAFEHDGQMTKQEVRTLVLGHLRPGGKRLLWDVGAGCGSVAIEWLRAGRCAEAVAIEPAETRRKMIAGNAERLGVPRLSIVAGKAPQALFGLMPPDAIFIGGGISDKGVFEACWDALPRFGRLVATAVTLESETRLAALHRRHGGRLSRLSAARAEPIGRFHGWKPFMPVTVWAVERDCDA